MKQWRALKQPSAEGEVGRMLYKNQAPKRNLDNHGLCFEVSKAAGYSKWSLLSLQGVRPQLATQNSRQHLTSVGSTVADEAYLLTIDWNLCMHIGFRGIFTVI